MRARLRRLPARGARRRARRAAAPASTRPARAADAEGADAERQRIDRAVERAAEPAGRRRSAASVITKPESDAAVPAFSGNGPTAPAWPQGWWMPWPIAYSHCGSERSPRPLCDAGQAAARAMPSAAGQREQRAAPHRAAQAVAQQQAPAQTGAGDVGERDRRAGSAPYSARRGAEHVDEHERRAGEQAEQAAVGAGREQRPGPKGRVARATAAQLRSSGARPRRVRVAPRHGLREAPARRSASVAAPNTASASSAACQPKPLRPAGRPRSALTHGDHAQAGQRARHHARAFVRLRTGRARSSGRRSRPRPSPRPAARARRSATRCVGERGAEHAGHDVEREADQQHRPAAEAVGQRPADQLRRSRSRRSAPTA